ncbi:MAG: DUF1002 domain-containing protein [Bacillus sp. (in: firmicutes)]
MNLFKQLGMALLTSLFLIIPATVSADAQAGDTVVTLGQNLTQQQRTALLNEMGVADDVEIVEVTNAEEHEYLGDYISSRLIGTKAISSSKITLGEKNSGLVVKVNNINWVTEEMYINALATAGVKDAEIYVTAPFEVSGTAALTGIIKAYELTSDEAIPEEVKQAANEEMVTAAELGDEIGTDETSALMTKIKEEISENPPKTKEEVEQIVVNASNELNINLTEEQKQTLVDLFNKLKELDIDWGQVQDQVSNVKDKLTEYFSSEEGQNFLDKVKEFFIALIDWFKSLFK